MLTASALYNVAPGIVKKAGLLLFCCLASLLLRAQEEKVAFNNIEQTGLLSGASQGAFSVQAIKGIRYKRYAAGIGLGYDSYGSPALPLFADIRYRPWKKIKWLKVYADAGLSIPLKNRDLPRTYPDGSRWHRLKSSFYGEAGISCKIVRWGEKGIILGVGYSYKTFHYAESRQVYDGPVRTAVAAYRYRYRRYAFRLGLVL